MGKYSAERYNPDLHQPKGASLLFDGAFLSFKNGNKRYAWKACSGKPVKGNFDYSVERQKIGGTGPIPEGVYWINPDEFRDNRGKAFLVSLNEGDANAQKFLNAWGDHAVTIHPFKKTETYGRGGFFIHGGKYAGSAGCIDVLSKIGAVRKVLEGLADDYWRDIQIHLTVDYSWHRKEFAKAV